MKCVALKASFDLQTGFSSYLINFQQVQCILDIATGLRHGGRGRHKQRGRYLCNDGGLSSIGDEVAIGSAAAISKVAISNGHCTQ